MKHWEGRAVREEARRWLLLMSSGAATAKEEKELEAWLDQSAEHRRSFAEVHTLWRELDQVPEAAWGVPEDSFYRRPRMVRFAAAASVVAVLVLGALVWRSQGLPVTPLPQELHYNTRTAELRSVTLGDGTIIELGARTRVIVEYEPDQRRVRLLGGEAYFNVSRQDARPFLVNVGIGTVRVVGTAFNVHMQEQQVTVAVARGEVAVLREVGAVFEESLSAGQQLLFAEDMLRRLPDRNTDEIASWRQGRKVFRDSPLSLVVADLNRYSQIPVVIADRELAELRVTGSFENFSDINTVLETIELSLPAQVVRTSDRVYLRARQ